MVSAMLLGWLVARAFAGECAVDADGDGAAGAELVDDGGDGCGGAGERPAAEAGADCDDADAAVHPGAVEVVGDTVDDDCDGAVICFADRDGDGWRTDAPDPGWNVDLDCDDVGEALASTPFPDCDDGDPATWPGAPEIVADDFDEDCDGAELCYPDRDGDGFRTDEVVPSPDADCDDAGEAHGDLPPGDCDDEDPSAVQDCAPDSRLTGSGCDAAGGLVPLGLAAGLRAALRRRRC